MHREYRNIKQYEKDILKLRADGLTYREIGECLGLEQIKIKKFVAGIAIRTEYLRLTAT